MSQPSTELDELVSLIQSLGYSECSVGRHFFDGALEYRTTFPAEWISEYFRQGYLAIDPIPVVSMGTRAPIRWSQIGKMFPKNEVLFASKEAGLGDGFSFSYGGTVVSVHTNERPTDTDIQTVRDGALTILKSERARTLHLTDRHIGTLLLIANGLTVDQIASISGVGPEAIKKRKKEILRLMNVQHMAKAVRIFFERGF